MSTQAVSWDDRPPLDQELRGIVRALVDRAKRARVELELAAAHLCRHPHCTEPIPAERSPIAIYCSRRCAKHASDLTTPLADTAAVL